MTFSHLKKNFRIDFVLLYFKKLSQGDILMDFFFRFKHAKQIETKQD